MNDKIVAVIPAFNEEETIEDVVKNVKNFVNEVIVVDDASTDKTSDIAIKNAAVVVRHEKNQGYDKTIDDGFEEAVRRNASIIITFDADGQHIPSDIPKLVNPIRNGEADVVVGIRLYKSRITETAFSWFSRWKIGVHDPLCGIKAYSAKAYQKVGYFDRLKSIGTELMFNCYTNGFRIKEVNIGINKREGKPKFGGSLKANWKIFVALCKILIKFR